MIRAILFDAGNTLIRVDWAAVSIALTAAGAPVAAETLRRAEWDARVRLDTDLFAPPGASSTESGDTTARYTQYVLEAAGLHDPALHARITAWRRSYNPPLGLWTVAEPEAGAALVLARETGCVTGVVSNSNGTAREALAAVGLAHHLDFVLDSHEEGVEKPDPRIFERALARAGVRPDEAAYIGDLYSIDIVGARRAGLRGVLMDPGGCWGERDCPRATTVLDAVRSLVGEPRA